MIDAWAVRHVMSFDDGISYLDVGDAYLRGDWQTAINAYWSPLYSWLLGATLAVAKPSPYWELPLVHTLNFAIYLAALACFHFLLRRVLEFVRLDDGGRGDGAEAGLPEWFWLTLGYSLFLWGSLRIISLANVTPDMCVAALVFLAAGLLLRIRCDLENWRHPVVLGAVLGFGYLAKTVMLPVGAFFLLAAFLSDENRRRAAKRVVIASVVLLLIGGPFIVALSRAKGRITFGDAGRLNYAWYVNGIKEPYWQGGGESGTPRHPTRRLLAKPAVYEFQGPVGVTYPPWFDPSYWYEGLQLHFHVREQMAALVSNARLYAAIFRDGSAFFFGALLLLMIPGRRLVCARLWSARTLLIPSLGAMALYSLVYLEGRHIGAFLVLVCMGLFSAARVPATADSKRLLGALVTLIALTTGLGLVASTGRLLQGRADRRLNHYEVADYLQRKGLQPGEKVAVIGSLDSNYWARLARVRIVATVPSSPTGDVGASDAALFWAGGDELHSHVMAAFRKTGARAVVATASPVERAPGWERIGSTDLCVYILER